MHSLEIKSIRIESSKALRGITPEQFTARLCEQIHGQIEAAKSLHSVTSAAHYLCSSTLDIVSSGGWIEPHAMCQQLSKKTALPSSFSNAMQCATWGSLVRQHLLNKPQIKDIFLSVVDANPLQMRFWEENESWGRTSHRVTLVHLRLPELEGAQMPALLQLGKCNPDVMLYEYGAELQKAAQNNEGFTVCVPYFAEKMRKGIKRALRGYPLLADRYEQFGHVCGSDPWISVALEQVDGVCKAQHYLLSSIASHGYFCFLKACTSTTTHVQIEE